jgi:hypothetical protein
MKKRKPKQPKPEHVRVQFNNFHPPVPVQPGDQVETSFTPDGPVIRRILRDGVQIWPER